MPAKRRKRRPKTREPKRKPTPAKGKKRTPAKPKPAPKRKVPPKRRKAAPAPKPAPKRKVPPKRRKAAPAPKRRKVAPPKPKPAKPKPRPKPRPKPTPQKKHARSQSAKKGWVTRRKRERLLEAMADLRMQREGEKQPIGWTQRRAQLREIDGSLWRRIAVEYSESEYEARRLATLEDLQIDLLNKADLYDYLSWVSQESDVDLGDLYEMYLGYTPGGGDGEG